MLKFIAGWVHVLLWLKTTLSPMLIGFTMAMIICIVRDDINIYLIASFSGIGLVIGIAWAEKTRRTIGLSKFHGRLIGHPEIDGSKTNIKQHDE
ncbi:hypothetical protein [Photobacterium nomapromontoriensis]|uniref:hypothetical protein n=1 Tax=Photobacterium nomapromontoriensis TaxID=2910237 RepID=UPI003D101970